MAEHAERSRRAAERILEDEGLTSDLTDDQAAPLLEWAAQQAAQAGADPSRGDAEVAAAVSALRRAVLRAATAGQEEHDPARLVELARAALTPADGGQAVFGAPAAAASLASEETRAAAPPQPAPTMRPARYEQVAAPPPTPPESIWGRLRRWLGISSGSPRD